VGRSIGGSSLSGFFSTLGAGISLKGVLPDPKGYNLLLSNKRSQVGKVTLGQEGKGLALSPHSSRTSGTVGILLSVSREIPIYHM